MYLTPDLSAASIAARWRCEKEIFNRRDSLAKLTMPATYLCPVMVFDRSIRDQEQRLDAVKGSLEGSTVVIVGFANGGTKSFLVGELLWRASDEDEVFGGQAV